MADYREAFVGIDVYHGPRSSGLLAADAGAGDEEIARSVGVGGSTVYRIKRRFVEGNLERAAERRAASRSGAQTYGQGRSLAGGDSLCPPEGHARWTLELLAGAMVKLTEHKSLSHETVRRRLAENDLKPWRKDMWCIPKVDGEYVARMEDVLDLYAEAPDPKRPVVCFDESPVQLIGEARQPIPARPGQLERFDYEYRRNGTVNLFVFLDVHRPWRKVKVTERRAAEDYAQCLRDLVDIHYPDAEIIRVVQDNLSTHSAGALYQTFPPAEARRILRRLEFHYTPKHASWLNMVEIEIGVLRGQCLDRRIDHPKQLRPEITAWERRRNAARSRIKWMFTTDKARAKMGRAYPATSKESQSVCRATSSGRSNVYISARRVVVRVILLGRWCDTMTVDAIPTGAVRHASIELLARLLCYGLRLPSDLPTEFREVYGLDKGFIQGSIFLIGGSRPINTAVWGEREGFPESVDAHFVHGQLWIRSDNNELSCSPIVQPLAIRREIRGYGRIGEYLKFHDQRTVFASPVRECVFGAVGKPCQFCTFQKTKPKPLPPAIFRTMFQEIAAEREIRSLAIGPGTPNLRDHGVRYIASLIEALSPVWRGPTSAELVPPHNLGDLQNLTAVGVGSLIMSIELWDDSARAELCPGKNYVSKEHYLAGWRKGVELLGSSMVSSVLLVGLEDIESTRRGIDLMVENGVVPTLIPFRPYQDTPLSDRKPVDYRTYLEISKYNVGAMRRNHLSPRKQVGCTECSGCSLETENAGTH
ncbi:IS630 family transposase [Bradyrhizobium valentinum]|uniref:IS630 family transposase n=1 Tax=Bradyrhizobium valentinum TaxID=1518501 RepID=UPI001FD99E78|nr:IS630 family transposase [Bradyrhizobium valentinum]